MPRLGALVFRVAKRWWPLAYMGLLGFTVGAEWWNRSVSDLRWHVTAAYVTSALWFMSWRLARRATRRSRRPASRSEGVPAPRPTRENDPGPYWLN